MSSVGRLQPCGGHVWAIGVQMAAQVRTEALLFAESEGGVEFAMRRQAGGSWESRVSG